MLVVVVMMVCLAMPSKECGITCIRQGLHILNYYKVYYIDIFLNMFANFTFSYFIHIIISSPTYYGPHMATTPRHFTTED